MTIAAGDLAGNELRRFSRRVGEDRNPQRMSFASLESSSEGSFSGFFGNSQAATIVVREEISGPEKAT
jgi:hypothetical protein